MAADHPATSDDLRAELVAAVVDRMPHRLDTVEGLILRHARIGDRDPVHDVQLRQEWHLDSVGRSQLRQVSQRGIGEPPGLRFCIDQGGVGLLDLHSAASELRYARLVCDSDTPALACCLVAPGDLDHIAYVFVADVELLHNDVIG